MIRRLPLTFKHIMYNLRGGFLVRPLCITLVLGMLGGALSYFEEIFPALSAWVPATLFPSKSDPQVAQIILSDISTSVMTVVSIVFAILLMSLTLASMQFSPRIIVSFSRDKVTQWILGIFLGTFSYCIAVLPAARTKPYAFSPVLSVFGAMILVLACVIGLLFFIHHISRAISVNFIVDRIAGETELMIDEFMAQPVSEKLWPIGSSGEEHAKIEVPLSHTMSGYICFIDTNRLVEIAKRYQLKVKVLKRVGQFIPAGVALMHISREERLTDNVRKALLSTFDIGAMRTLQQDVEFGVLQIVDIALKAISPAVNDPSTAISCIDQLSRVLGRFAMRQTPSSYYYDPPGIIRVSVPWIEFDALLESAFDQIRLYARADMAVSLRILRALHDIAEISKNPEVYTALLALGQRTIDSCTGHLDAMSMQRLHQRIDELKSIAR
ncbi:DUF2254 domain-containing protein [Undibacterium sp. Ji67W]|uniref:DUF2254 domain-containing protein n=1 Tax=Undibacterium sp. Ji67W TaxID=3413042 RepID=UPI003BF0131E